MTMKRLITAVFAVAVAVALVGFQAQAQAKEWTTVRIGVEGAYPPFSYVDKDGNLKGFDIDIAYALCAAMKVECVLVTQDWDGIIPALMARKYDAIIASLSITEERKQKLDFTNKYYNTPVKFIAKQGAGVEISKEGLKGKSVGVQRATIHDKYLTDNYGDVVEIKRYGTQDEAYLDISAGRVDMLLADSVALSDGFLKTEAGAGFEFVGPDLTDVRWFGEGEGIALRKGEDELREMFNQAIATIREDGTYKAIQDKYFDFNIYGE